MKTIQQKNTNVFLQGSGEMAELTRSFDWSSTSLGEPSEWPQSLLTTVSNLLRSRFPMFLWWGSEMIQFYNDAYRASLGINGKHSLALGQEGKECWPETWEIISPFIRIVETTGEPVWMENQMVPVFRNGKMEDAYWTYSYSSVLDDMGEHGGILVTCMETTEFVKSQTHLRESEARFRNLIEQAPVAIGVTRGEDMIVESINPPMLQLINKKSKNDVVGKKLMEVLPELKSQPIYDILCHVITSGETFSGSEIPVELKIEDKMQTGYYNITYSRVVDNRGIAVLHIATSVTKHALARQKIEELVVHRTKELADANRSLQSLNNELQRSNADLEEFAHAASHDLKEPVRKIHYFINQLKAKLSAHLNDGEDNFFLRIEKATERMSNLIDDLLIFSHVSQRQPEMENIDLNKKLQLVLEDLELNIKEKNASIYVEDLPIIRGYRRQLQQLFQNLISNALKYSKPEVPPLIYVSACKVEEINQSYHRIEVKDNGIGFDQQYADKIFQMFTRLHGRSEYSGTGIGLSIVKKVVENHNGMVRVRSTLGEGSTFEVFFPAEH